MVHFRKEKQTHSDLQVTTGKPGGELCRLALRPADVQLAEHEDDARDDGVLKP